MGSRGSVATMPGFINAFDDLKFKMGLNRPSLFQKTRDQLGKDAKTKQERSHSTVRPRKTQGRWPPPQTVTIGLTGDSLGGQTAWRGVPK